MDTRFLDTFLAVVEGGSVAAAARQLNLTPAGVLQRLRALEAEIGAGLLVRSGRRLVPTAAGMAIAARARPLLAQIRDLRLAVTDGAPAGPLRLGAVPTAITGLLPDILTAMRAAHPGIEIGILPGRSGDLYAQVLDGELDAAILVQPHFPLPKTCHWRTLREEPLIVLAPAAMAGMEPHGLLRSEPFIRYDPGSWGGRLAENYLRRAGLRPRDRFELVTLDAIAVLVDRGLGVSLVPDWCRPWPEGLSLARIPLPGAAPNGEQGGTRGGGPAGGRDEVPVRRMGLLWSGGSARLRLVEALAAGLGSPGFRGGAGPAG